MDFTRASQVWLAVLVAGSFIFSLGYACAVPLAAFGAAAALTLPRREAVLLMIAIWFANQIVGYAVLDYPWTLDTLAWGAVLGVSAVAATVAARAAVRAIAAGRILACLGAFLAAFIAYEATLFVAALALGGLEDFAPAVMGQVFAINAAAALGLFVLHLACRAFLPGRIGLRAKGAFPGE